VAMLISDIKAELIPGLSAAGFSLGEDFFSIQEKIGAVGWYESNACLNDVLIKSAEWIGIKSKVGTAVGLEKVVESFIYRNDLISLDFGKTKKLYRIVVGKGYLGRFKSVRPGDDLLLISSLYELDFNDVDDDFLIIESGDYIEGISFITDYRSSLEHAPDQKIECISIHDWSFR